MRVVADLDRCCGTGQCVMNAPEVFDQNEEDGTVVVLREVPDPDQEEAVHRAVRHCPTEALAIAGS
ncbi:ferredoxin [Amycolatopsis sp. K13G38]|uniref:Ferredoxin n=1 Tax=Amycolatopsis acididurans TaxID=2724524 RepID=A0ABX1J3P2_9PSEU|nr:ferredoxin [Amycolatopsis acididurans]NKQ54284.1 ferredoxin [Amycolatopsis acididurans]